MILLLLLEQSYYEILKILPGGIGMDFNLSKEQELVKQISREFAENELKPIVAECDEKSIYTM